MPGFAIDRMPSPNRLTSGTVQHMLDGVQAGDEGSLAERAAKAPGYERESEANYDAELIPRQNPFGGMIPEDVKVYVVSAYNGERTAIQIDDSGHETTVIRLTVNSPDVPVALILSAYDPNIWQISWTPQTRICAVVASGYHKQFVNGLPDGIPVLVFENTYYDVKRKGDVDSLTALSTQYFNHKPDASVQAQRGETIVGLALRTGDRAITAKEFAEMDFHLPGAPLAGKEGLEEAVAKKLLREATAEDFAEWQRISDAMSAKEKSASGRRSRREPTAWSPIHAFKSYVVLSPDFIVPNGLAGAHSVTFFIPAGIPMPKGDPGHCTFLSIEDGTAIGPGVR